MLRYVEAGSEIVAFLQPSRRQEVAILSYHEPKVCPLETNNVVQRASFTRTIIGPFSSGWKNPFFVQ